MKNTLKIAVVLSLLYSITGFSQAIEITPSYGYQFGSKLGYSSSYVKIKGSGQYGVTVGVEAYTGLMAEFTYTNMSSELRIRDSFLDPPINSETMLADLNANWFMLGTTQYFQEGKIKPFAGGALGVAVFSPKKENRDLLDDYNITGNIDSSTNFAFSLKAGVNIMFTDAIGLNLQGNLYLPVNWAGVYIGPGGAGISAGSTVIFGGLSGGLVFRIDKD